MPPSNPDAYTYIPLTYTNSTLSLPSTTSPQIDPSLLTQITTLSSLLPPPTDTLSGVPLPPGAQVDRSLLPMIQQSAFLAKGRTIAEKSGEVRKAAETLLNKPATATDAAALDKVLALADEAIALAQQRPPWERVFSADELGAAYTLRAVAGLRKRDWASALVDSRIVLVLKKSVPDNLPMGQQKRLALAYVAGATALREMRRVDEARQWVVEGLAQDAPQLEALGRQIRQLMENKWVVGQAQGGAQQVMNQQGRQELQGRYQNWSREVEQLRKLGKDLLEEGGKKG